VEVIKDRVIFHIKKNNRPQPKWGGQYPHVVEDKIYYELQHPSEICYVTFDGDNTSKPNNNIILKDSLGANNFRVFIDTNPNILPEEKYKAIGGYHVSNDHGELVGLMESQQRFCFDPVWPKESKDIIKDDFYHPRHANGLYIFKSRDGINWSEYHTFPIFSRFTKCVDSNDENLPEGTIGFDWMPSIFFDHNINEYVIYIRANITLGCRHVLYSKSTDLINWSTPRLINCDPVFDIENKQNFYYAGVYPIKDKYIAFPPHFTNKILDAEGNHRTYTNACTHVMISSDGINWKTVDKIFQSSTGGHMTFPHVVSFEQKEQYTLYVHEGFGTDDNKLVSYKVRKEEIECFL